MKSNIAFEWWNADPTSDFVFDEVPESHREALERAAIRIIADSFAQGNAEGEMHERIFDEREGEKDDGTYYRGYWKRVIAPSASDSYEISPEIQATVQKVREIAGEACESAHAAGVRGAINWGDLGVVEVRFCINEVGEEAYDILIGEAAPGNGELIEYVSERIGDTCKPYSYEIRTEW